MIVPNHHAWGGWRHWWQGWWPAWHGRAALDDVALILAALPRGEALGWVLARARAI